MNETTATCLVYSMGVRECHDMQQEHTILIYNLGGGSFDASIITIDARSCRFEVKAVAGNSHLVGEDFDKRLVDHFVQEFMKKHNKDLNKNPKALQRLRMASEKAKVALSTKTIANIELDSLYQDIDFYLKISRARFDELCSDLFISTLNMVEKALNDAQMDKISINDIVLVGGSTCIPKIRSLLQNFFNGSKLNISMDALEAVVYGAAVEAASLMGDSNHAIEVTERAPFSLTMEASGGLTSCIIKGNSCYPFKQTQEISTYTSFQPDVMVHEYEGENCVLRKNNLLGTFDIMGIPLAPRGVPKIEVSFNMDMNGILAVSAKETSSERSRRLVVHTDKGRLLQEEIEAMSTDAKQCKDEDQRQNKTVEMRYQIETCAFNVKQAVGEAGNRISEFEKVQVKSQCDRMLQWLDKNATAKQNELEHKLQEMNLTCSIIMAKLKKSMKETSQLPNIVTIV